jgi:hypothetical protein
MVSPSARQIVSAPARRCIWHLPWFWVRVDSKIHGKARPNTEVTVFSENSPRFFPMYVGQQYVLYLQPQYGRNQVDNCGNSHPTTENSASTKQPKQTATRGF